MQTDRRPAAALGQILGRAGVLRQLCHVGRDAPRLVAGEDFGRLDYRTFPPNCSMNARAVAKSEKHQR